MRNNLYSTTCLLFIFLMSVEAQVTNSGQLVILPNTEVGVYEDLENTISGSVEQNGNLYIHQNFTNRGQFLYSSIFNSGTTHFIGASLQEILSPNMSLFYNVSFDNSFQNVAFKLDGSIFTENEVNFSQGIIESRLLTNTFAFSKDAYHTNTSNSSYVNGAVQKDGDKQFNFPVGRNGFYRSIEISAPDDETDFFSAEYFAENSNAGYPHDLKVEVIDVIDTREYWVLNRDTGNSNIIVTLNWNEDTTSPEILRGSKSRIHVVRWDESKGFWVDEGGIIDENARTVTTVTNVSGYGIFALARVKEEVILPGGCAIVVYNAITPGTDGKNDILRISCIDQFPENRVEIFNRWGVKVFEIENYDNEGNVFRGFSDARGTLNRREKLPTGTYFYILNYRYNSQQIRKAGYLYIKSKS